CCSFHGQAMIGTPVALTASAEPELVHQDPVQLSLGFAGIPARRVSVGARSNRRHPSVASRSHPESFRRRLATTGASPKAQQAYTWQMDQLMLAARRHGL